MVQLNARVSGVRIVFEKESEEVMSFRGVVEHIVLIAPSGYTHYQEVNAGCDVKVTLIGENLEVIGCNRHTKEVTGDVKIIEILFPDGSKRTFDVFPDTFVLKERETEKEISDSDEETDEETYHEVNEGTDDEDDDLDEETV